VDRGNELDGVLRRDLGHRTTQRRRLTGTANLRIIEPQLRLEVDATSDDETPDRILAEPKSLRPHLVEVLKAN
jgi:hypothetical protein